jgi:hypothetical protein
VPPAIFEKGIGQWRISEETSSRPDTNRVQRSPGIIAKLPRTCERSLFQRPLPSASPVWHIHATDVLTRPAASANELDHPKFAICHSGMIPE